MTSERKGVLLVAAAALLWSSGGLGIKFLAAPPLTIACYRSGVAALALFAVLRPRVPRLSPAFVVGVAAYAAVMVTFVLATKMTSAANAIFLQYCGVIWVLLLGPRVLGEPFRARDAIAVAGAFLGMSIFFLGKFDSRGIEGELMALASSVGFAILLLALRRQRDAGPATISYGNLAVFVVLLPFLGEHRLVSPTSAVVLVALGAFQIGMAYAVFLRGLARVTAVEAGLVGMLEPVLNPVWVLLFLGERPGVASIVGGAVVLAAVAWRTVTGERRPRPGLAT